MAAVPSAIAGPPMSFAANSSHKPDSGSAARLTARGADWLAAEGKGHKTHLAVVIDEERAPIFRRASLPPRWHCAAAAARDNL